MSGDIQHVILTRFNLPSAGAEKVVRGRADWLAHRVALFERYCLPSVRAQTCRRFHWLIYFDPDSPRWLHDKIRAHTSEGIYVPLFRASLSGAELMADIRRVAGTGGQRLITTNLDNDDGLASNCIERLQAVEPGPGRTAVYLGRGLIKAGGRVYLRRDSRNAFCSVVEDWAEPVTCWSEWHTLLHRKMRVLEIRDEPGWLQVVHGENVSNRVRGRLVSPLAYQRLFPGLLGDVRAPGVLEIAGDLAIVGPGRLARESGRAAVKAAALRLLGREGLDRVKTRVASRAGERQRASAAGSGGGQDAV